MASLTSHPLFHSPSLDSSEVLDTAQKGLVAELNRKLASGELGLETVPCLCGSTHFDLVAKYDRYRVAQDTVLCRQCGLMQSQPRMGPDALSWFYGSDFYRHLYGGLNVDRYTPANFESGACTDAARTQAIRDSLDMASIRSIAEVGSGAGWNLWPFHKAGIRVVGCDFSPALTAAGRAAGMDIRLGPVQEALAGETVDLLILSHVVEHFSDPVGEVRDIVSLLSPAHVYIEVPNVDEFCIGTLQSAHNYTFSKGTLVAAMAKAGLVAQRDIPRNCHFAVLFSRDGQPKFKPETAGEYERVVRIISRYERRERIKGWLAGVGLLSFARRLLSLLRS
jgi:hypothetical protein